MPWKCIWSGGIAPPSWLWHCIQVSNHLTLMPLPSLPQGERVPWYPIDRRLGGIQNQSVCTGEEENFLLLLVVQSQFLSPLLYQPTTVQNIVKGPRWVITIHINRLHGYENGFENMNWTGAWFWSYGRFLCWVNNLSVSQGEQIS
jgi:hypothetical protein